MKAINLLRGIIMALITALIITVVPAQTSLFAKDTSGTITHADKHKTASTKAQTQKEKILYKRQQRQNE